MYLLGPYLLGVTAANPELNWQTLPWLLAFALYFTFPANLLVYGVNDIFDYDTDCLNPKKSGYESLVLPSERASLLRTIAFSSTPFVVLLLLCHTPPLAALYLIAFLLLSIFYSAPPIRAKVRPFLDSAFNLLYAMPGFFGWAFADGGRPQTAILIAALAWTMAMHAYSAVPDINADREAGLSTVATVLGARATVVGCLVLYALAAVLSVRYISGVGALLGTVYCALMLASLAKDGRGYVMSLYKNFPLVNTVAGFIIFVAIFALKHLKV